MRYLIISDLHGNYEALEAVLEDSGGRYDQIVCCGDLVGYGPDPNRIVEWAKVSLFAVIRGNHDRACCGLEDLEWFNPVAQDASRWTMRHLTRENHEWLRALPSGPIQVNGFTVAHGSPLDEDEYVASLDDAANVFDYLNGAITFFGHTHLQGGFVQTHGRRVALVRPRRDEPSLRLRLDSEAVYMINPGSIGQPRDADPRAAYAVFDSEAREVTLCRAVYDWQAVRRKIEEAGLPPALGQRLALGR